MVSQGAGGERKAGGLAGLYREKLRKYDDRYHDTLRDQTGPLVQCLQSYGALWGLVVWPWGDISKDSHHLIKVLGEQRVTKQERSRGVVRGDQQLGVVIGQIHRVLSCSFVRSQALCLISRLGQLDPGAKSAADRQAAAQQCEYARRQEAQANWNSQVMGRGLSRIGMLFTP